MCIICNMTTGPINDFSGVLVAEAYLDKADEARKAMKAAADAMLACAEKVKDPGDRRRYDATHKAMVRAIRDWNRIEQSRETGQGCGG